MINSNFEDKDMFKLFNVINKKIEKYDINEKIKEMTAKLGQLYLDQSLIKEAKKKDEILSQFNNMFIKKISKRVEKSINQ